MSNNKTSICKNFSFNTKMHKNSQAVKMVSSKSATGKLQCRIADKDFVRSKVSGATNKSTNLTLKKNKYLVNKDCLEFIKEEEDNDDEWEDEVDEDYEKNFCNICTEKIEVYAIS